MRDDDKPRAWPFVAGVIVGGTLVVSAQANDPKQTPLDDAAWWSELSSDQDNLCLANSGTQLICEAHQSMILLLRLGMELASNTSATPRRARDDAACTNAQPEDRRGDRP
jgi:hypothetical protein